MNAKNTESPAMLKIYIVRSGGQYIIGKFVFGDVVGLVIYLKARGVTQEDILNAIEVLAHDGACTIEHE